MKKQILVSAGVAALVALIAVKAAEVLKSDVAPESRPTLTVSVWPVLETNTAVLRQWRDVRVQIVSNVVQRTVWTGTNADGSTFLGTNEMLIGRQTLLDSNVVVELPVK